MYKVKRILVGSAGILPAMSVGFDAKVSVADQRDYFQRKFSRYALIAGKMPAFLSVTWFS